MLPTLPRGTCIGSYEIVDVLGAGGMGVVYRATDIRLKRQIALKVLPAALTNDPDRLARFQREAEVLASLNHPNIAAIYGLEETQVGQVGQVGRLRAEGDSASLVDVHRRTGRAEAGQAGARALVMELVEGPTLADRIAGTSPPP